MPLYVTYKHLLFNHGRYNTIKECTCSKLSAESIPLVYLYCQTNSSSSSSSSSSSNNNNNSIVAGNLNMNETNLPIELLRNIAHFIDLNGLGAIRTCFTNSTSSDTLPLQIAHILFNVIVNVS